MKSNLIKLLNGQWKHVLQIAVPESRLEVFYRIQPGDEWMLMEEYPLDITVAFGVSRHLQPCEEEQNLYRYEQLYSTMFGYVVARGRITETIQKGSCMVMDLLGPKALGLENG